MFDTFARIFLPHMHEFFVSIFDFNPTKPLIFTQFYFWAFFAVVYGVFSAIHKKEVPRNAFLFLVSLFFYWKTGGFFVSLLILSTVVDLYIGNALYRLQNQRKRKLLIATSLVVNLFILAYYKYTGFFIGSVNTLFDMHIPVVDLFSKWTNEIGGTHFSIDKIILPVGISFYTFQTLSYSIDIYRRKLEPVKNIIDFGFYVTFFPQLVAGPIVRASEFIPQIYKKFELSRAEFGVAVFMILNGLFKKMFISDYIAVNFIDRVFSSPLTFSGVENLFALYAYSFQVYADFSGYTDIAIGLALLMGFRLNPNFNSPYKAQSTGEFWKRWHISLSTWLKDYLYIPLGGNKYGAMRTNINLMLTMLIGGLWHGASWQFVIWGGLNGVGLVVYKYWKKISPFNNNNSWLVRFYAIFLTFNFITATRIWFRAENMSQVNDIMHQITTAFEFGQIGQVILAYKYVFLVLAFGLTVHWLPTNWKTAYVNYFSQTPHWAKVAAIVVVVFAIWQMRTAELQPFIYFAF